MEVCGLLSLFATVDLGKLSIKATCQLLRGPFYPLVILKFRKNGPVREITQGSQALKHISKKVQSYVINSRF
jgi:hypothetical protein